MQKSSKFDWEAWKVIAITFLCQNTAMGFCYGSFGPLLPANEAHFGISRGLASTGVSVMMLIFSLSSPVIGNLLQRVPLKPVLVSGAIISAIGYMALGYAPNFTVALMIYGVIGLGCGLLGIIGPITLLSRWFNKGRAQAMAIMNLPILLLLTPFVIAEVMQDNGREVVYLGIAAVFALLTPVLFFVIEDPALIGQKPRGGAIDTGALKREVSDDTVMSNREILLNPTFWILVIAIGAMAAGGIVGTVHIAPLGLSRDMSPAAASLLLSTFAASGILGNIVFGWLAERIGPPAALSTAIFCQGVFSISVPFLAGPSLYLAAGLLGMCCVPIVMLHGSTLSTLFGVANVSRTMGISFAIKLPFIFSAAPIAGYLYTSTGGYVVPFVASGIMLVTASLSVALLIYVKRGKARVASPVA